MPRAGKPEGKLIQVVAELWKAKITEHILQGERGNGKIAFQPPTSPRSGWGPKCGSGLGLMLGKTGKEWDPGTQGWGVCMKVFLKFESPNFLEHSRPAEELFPSRDQLAFA